MQLACPNELIWLLMRAIHLIHLLRLQVSTYHKATSVTHGNFPCLKGWSHLALEITSFSNLREQESLAGSKRISWGFQSCLLPSSHSLFTGRVLSSEEVREFGNLTPQAGWWRSEARSLFSLKIRKQWGRNAGPITAMLTDSLLQYLIKTEAACLS